MTFSKDELSKIPISYATCSIGCSADHTLPKKLDAFAAAHFSAIELSMPDLLAFASNQSGREIQPNDYSSLCEAATQVKSLCDSRGLKILMLQPFANFEGWQEGSPERKDAFDGAKGWIQIMKACGTDILQVGSSDTPADKIGTDRNRFVSDLRQLADMLAENKLRLAYENWCWSTHAPDWKSVWDIVKKVDRANIGLCLDTFQSAGGEYGDPTTKSGIVEDGRSAQQVQTDFEKSMAELASEVPANKIYLLQISDAYKLLQPFSTEPDESGMRPRGRWSHDYRPLPVSGGYLPIKDVARAVLKTGFRGYFSYEIFDHPPDAKRSYDLDNFAKAAYGSHEQFLDELRQ